MATLITLQQAQAWLEATKLTIASLDANLLTHTQNEVLARLASSYDVSGWIDTATTPALVQTIIAKYYAAFYYDRAYSEDIGTNENTWAQRLINNAELLIGGIIDGSIQLLEVTNSTAGEPSFYPNDASSSQDAGVGDDWSLGDAKFSMGTIF